MSDQVNVYLHRSEGDHEDWWAECLLCQWVCTSNPDRGTAEEKFGRHYQNEHQEGFR